MSEPKPSSPWEPGAILVGAVIVIIVTTIRTGWLQGIAFAGVCLVVGALMSLIFKDRR